MKFGKIKFMDWHHESSHKWIRYEDNFPALSTIHIVKIYGRYTEGYAWYPEFHGEMNFMNEIYAYTTGFKEFKYNGENEAKKYVDDFLIRMDKLKVFT
jgi:hypothetical protein